MTALAKNHAIFQEKPKLLKDHRRHRRVNIKLHGRFLNDNSEEHGLVTQNISCGGALLQSLSFPEVGSQIVCYIDELGRIVGKVVRIADDNMFAIAFKVSQLKRDRLADKLIWLANKDRLGLVEERRAQRFAAEGPALITRQDGRKLQCSVIDISLTGAGFVTDGPAPMVGEIINIGGTMTAEVMRSTPKEFGVRFLNRNIATDIIHNE